jgi:hypothetical protein
MADEDKKPIEASEDKPAFVEQEGEKTMELDEEVKVEDKESEEKIDEKVDEKVDKKEEEVEEKPFRSFKTPEELDEFIRQEAERRAAKPEKEDKKPERKAVELYKGYFDEKTGKWVGETPRDWNEFANKIIDAMTPQVAETVQTMSTKEREELTKINQGFDREYNELASKKLVPPLNTKEGTEVNRQISLIGATYGQTNITKAYQLWASIPKDKGGGLDYESGAKAEKDNKAKAQKQAAGKVGSSKGTPSKQKGKSTSYDKLRSTPIDDLIDEQLEK